MKVRQICSTCKSENVLRDAFAGWDIAEQKWFLQESFNFGGYCQNCENTCSIIEEEVSV
jgi:hypothetical protein